MKKRATITSRTLFLALAAWMVGVFGQAAALAQPTSIQRITSKNGSVIINPSTGSGGVVDLASIGGGGAFQPANVTLTNWASVPSIFFDGDSLTDWTNVASGQGFGGLGTNYPTDWPNRLLQLPGFYFHSAANDFAVTGHTIWQNWTNFSIGPGAVTNSNKMLFTMCGINDASYGSNLAQIQINESNYWKLATNAGFSPLVIMIEWTNSTFTDAQRQVWSNAQQWIRTNSPNYGVVIDVSGFVTNYATQTMDGLLHLNAANNAALARVIAGNFTLVGAVDDKALNRITYADYMGSDSNILTIMSDLQVWSNALFRGAITSQYLLTLGGSASNPDIRGSWGSVGDLAVNATMPTSPGTIVAGSNIWAQGQGNNGGFVGQIASGNVTNQNGSRVAYLTDTNGLFPNDVLNSQLQLGYVEDVGNAKAYFNSTDSGIGWHLVNRIIGNVPFKVDGAAGQTAHLQDWTVNAGAPLASIDAAGNFSASSISGATGYNSTNIVLGIGAGLSTGAVWDTNGVKQSCISQMGGSIWLTNGSGSGTAFAVIFTAYFTPPFANGTAPIVIAGWGATNSSALGGYGIAPLITSNSVAFECGTDMGGNGSWKINWIVQAPPGQ